MAETINIKYIVQADDHSALTDDAFVFTDKTNCDDYTATGRSSEKLVVIYTVQSDDHTANAKDGGPAFDLAIETESGKSILDHGMSGGEDLII